MTLQIGTKITVMHRGAPMQATIHSLPSGISADPMSNAYTYEGHTTATQDGFLFPEGEGVDWLLGWGEDAGAVLSATQALSPEPELFFGTSTGRWSAARPNIQNYPKPARGPRP